ncbi:FHS family L-fucose permease-like MFS transporter [Catalinimonas alkaloidigena]|uniref:sugar MFS transporter n=1 Tax=Catalinimonas alkaloidigena TaxID=1075417 RepID=UPI0024054DF2|nr:sugar MFS transporter [Catalinimonas alkaloidigena]MDF9797586.1 FHS family L-fucose permease-like MFS transporter [Catalinimonas alkaloidigena]
MAQAPAQQVVSTETTNFEKQNYTPALITLAVLYFMMGFITCLNDTLVPFFKKGFDLTYSQSSLVQFYFFLTYGVMSIPAGKLVGRIGYKQGMVWGFSVAAFGALLFFPASLMHQYVLFLAALFIVAAGIVLLQVAANPYITVLGPARTASARLTLIQGVGSIGTTVAPIFGAYLILSRLPESEASSEAVKYPYLGITALLVCIALVVSRLRLPEIRTSSGDSAEHKPQKSSSIFSFRNLNFGIWAIFFYVGAEVSIGSFLTNYIADALIIAEETANSYVAFFWGSMLIGRLIGAYLLKAVRPAKVLTFCAALAIALIIISVSSTGLIAVWTMIAVGLSNSVMFAIIFSLSVQGLGKYTTQASGLLSTAIVGGAIISLSQGLVKDHASWAVSFMIPLACYVYILFYGLYGYQSKFRKEEHDVAH